MGGGFLPTYDVSGMCHIFGGRSFAQDPDLSDSVAKSATQKPWVFWDCTGFQ